MNEKNLSNFKNMPKERHIELSRKGGINSGKSRRRIRMLAKIVDIWTNDTIKWIERDMEKSLERDVMQGYGEKINSIVDATIEDLESIADKIVAELESDC